MFATVPMLSLRQEVDRLFDETFAPGLGAALGRDGVRPAWIPAADVRETENEYVIELDLPGVSPSEVEVSIERGVLSVTGGRADARREGERSHLRERATGRFVRSFRLPKGFDEQAIVAESENGVLRVRLPKAALPQPRRITVTAAGAEAPRELSASHDASVDASASPQEQPAR